MDTTSTLGRTIAVLTAVVELLDDDGNLNITMPPLRVEFHPSNLDQPVTFTASGISDNPNSYKGLLVPVTVHLADRDDIEVTVKVSHGQASAPAHTDHQVEDILDAIADLIGDASDGGTTTDLHQWFSAYETFAQLRANLERVVDPTRLTAAVRTVAPFTAAGALAADWHSDLPTLADAARALAEPTETPTG